MVYIYSSLKSNNGIIQRKCEADAYLIGGSGKPWYK